ncbi:MAG: 16S rRNA (cytosine(1402)-N(4))-methyltransferase RsmH [Acidobacteriota bacterium]
MQTLETSIADTARYLPGGDLPFHVAGGDGDRDAGPARQPESPTSPGNGPPAHRPVMADEVISLLAPGGGVYVDATVGLGGHAERILEASGDARLIGIDRDAESLALARQRLERFASRLTLVHGDYRDLPEILEREGLDRRGCLAGLVADLGISSYQLTAEGRGFSFRRDEPLDMRMDRSQDLTAADILNRAPEHELARIIFEFGEERRSRALARAIVRERDRGRLRTTHDLVRIVDRVLRRRGRRIHPATRVFQALRIAVNQELRGIDKFVLDSVEALQARGRLILLAFHSLEDRLVKTSLHHLSRQCTCPRSLPRCACDTPNRVALLNRKPLRPGVEEIAANPRARSARLRAAERL